ncbi:MAG: putative DNA-binding domain-containing protein [Polyangiales bacterium]
MSEAYGAALLRLAFAREPAPEALAGFAVYREMIRARFFGMARNAYRRTWRMLGARACDESFARYLEACPPRSPLVRAVMHEFAAFACGDTLGEAAPYARDLLRFEAAKWEVADALSPPSGALAELDFDGTPALNPTLRVLALGWAVDDAEAAPMPEPHALLVYRREGEDDVHWFRAEPVLGALLARSAEGEPLGVALPAALRAHGVVPDEAFLGALAQFLELAVARGVVLGVRAS